MRTPVRALLVAMTMLMATVTLPEGAGVGVAHADEEVPLSVGTTLVARSDCELQKVVIARGAKLHVTGSAAKTVDVALQDGYVLKRIPMGRIRYFFDVVR